MAYKTFCDTCDAAIENQTTLIVSAVGTPLETPMPPLYKHFCSMRCIQAWASKLTDADELPSARVTRDAS